MGSLQLWLEKADYKLQYCHNFPPASFFLAFFLFFPGENNCRSRNRCIPTSSSVSITLYIRSINKDELFSYRNSLFIHLHADKFCYEGNDWCNSPSWNTDFLCGFPIIVSILFFGGMTWRYLFI